MKTAYLVKAANLFPENKDIFCIIKMINEYKPQLFSISEATIVMPNNLVRKLLNEIKDIVLKLKNLTSLIDKIKIERYGPVFFLERDGFNEIKNNAEHIFHIYKDSIEQIRIDTINFNETQAFNIKRIFRCLNGIGFVYITNAIWSFSTEKDLFRSQEFKEISNMRYVREIYSLGNEIKRDIDSFLNDFDELYPKDFTTYMKSHDEPLKTENKSSDFVRINNNLSDVGKVFLDWLIEDRQKIFDLSQKISDAGQSKLNEDEKILKIMNHDGYDYYKNEICKYVVLNLAYKEFSQVTYSISNLIGVNSVHNNNVKKTFLYEKKIELNLMIDNIKTIIRTLSESQIKDRFVDFYSNIFDQLAAMSGQSLDKNKSLEVRSKDSFIQEVSLEKSRYLNDLKSYLNNIDCEQHINSFSMYSSPQKLMVFEIYGYNLAYNQHALMDKSTSYTEQHVNDLYGFLKYFGKISDS